MTNDVAPLTHKRVLRVALPIVLSSATVPLLGAVDLGVVGQTGQAVPIAAVGIGSVVLTTIYWVFGFLRMGTTGLVGQAEGEGDTAEVSAFLTRALLIAVGAGLALIALQSVLFAFALSLSPASKEVENLATAYLGIRIWSAPAAISVYALTGWLVAMERTGRVLILQLVMNGTNIVLDIWFVLGLGWGVEGVAIATVIAEVAGALVGVYLCAPAFRNPAWRDWKRISDRAKLLRMALVNSDILVRSAALLAIFTSFTFFSARFGDETLAANQVLMQFLTLSAFALDGFAHAAETLVARAVGRKDVARLRRAAWLCGLWGAVSAFVLVVAFALFGRQLIELMTTAPNVRLEAEAYMVWVVISPLLAVWAFTLDGIFIGATRGPDLRNMMLISMVIYLGAVWILMPSFGNHGLWLALLISLVARGVTLGWRYPKLEASVASPKA
ncbi:MAG: MATE family efflux transporter [Aliishimia sp.]